MYKPAAPPAAKQTNAVKSGIAPPRRVASPVNSCSKGGQIRLRMTSFLFLLIATFFTATNINAENPAATRVGNEDLREVFITPTKQTVPNTIAIMKTGSFKAEVIRDHPNAARASVHVGVWTTEAPPAKVRYTADSCRLFMCSIRTYHYVQISCFVYLSALSGAADVMATVCTTTF